MQYTSIIRTWPRQGAPGGSMSTAEIKSHVEAMFAEEVAGSVRTAGDGRPA